VTAWPKRPGDARAGEGAEAELAARRGGERRGDAVAEVAQAEARGEQVVGAEHVVDETPEEGGAALLVERTVEVAAAVELLASSRARLSLELPVELLALPRILLPPPAE
jgi:hypothetical protein